MSLEVVRDKQTGSPAYVRRGGELISISNANREWRRMVESGETAALDLSTITPPPEEPGPDWEGFAKALAADTAITAKLILYAPGPYAALQSQFIKWQTAAAVQAAFALAQQQLPQKEALTPQERARINEMLTTFHIPIPALQTGR